VVENSDYLHTVYGGIQELFEDDASDFEMKSVIADLAWAPFMIGPGWTTNLACTSPLPTCKRQQRRSSGAMPQTDRIMADAATG